ncbi:MAG: glycosyltransferase [Terriglobales bacterium]
MALDLLRAEQERTGRIGHLAVAVNEHFDLGLEAKELGVEIVSLGWKHRRFLQLGRDMYGLLRRVRPSGVICYALGLHVPVAAAAYALGIPTVVHIGNAPPPLRLDQWKIAIEMHAGRPFVKRYIACSKHVRACCVRQYGMPSVSIAAVINGIQLEHFAKARTSRSRASEWPVVGMVASFESQKNQVVLLRAAAILKARGVHILVRLVGSGSREPQLRELAMVAGVLDRVEWIGMVQDVAAQLCDFDLFAYAVNRQEGLGIALIEALAAGLPIVAADVGACREVLADGRWGTLVAPDDAGAWADAIENCLHHHVAPPTNGDLAEFDIRHTWDAYDTALQGDPVRM